jgi:hypothetical protein
MEGEEDEEEKASEKEQDTQVKEETAQTDEAVKGFRKQKNQPKKNPKKKNLSHHRVKCRTGFIPRWFVPLQKKKTFRPKNSKTLKVQVLMAGFRKKISWNILKTGRKTGTATVEQPSAKPAHGKKSCTASYCW